MSVDTYKKEVSMMKLDNLTELLEGVPEVSFPISHKELLSRFEQLYTGAVNDVLREFCLVNQALPGHIVPLRGIPYRSRVCLYGKKCAAREGGR